MNQILRCGWLPERARWSYLARSGLPDLSRKKNFPRKPYNKSFIDQACSVKMYGLLTKCEVKMAGYWPSSFFCVFMNRDGVEVHKHAKKNSIFMCHFLKRILDRHHQCKFLFVK